MEPRVRRPRRRPRPEWLPVLLLLHSSPVAGRRHAAPAAAFIPSHPSRPPSWRPPLQLGSSITTDDDDAPRYAARGVSAYKGEVLAAVGQRQPHDQPPQPPPLLPSLYPDAFCRLVPDVLTGSLEHALVMHADGAGTKAALAYLYWKETGDMSVWRGIAQDALTMNLDDVFCCGATGPALMTSTIGRNRRLVPGEVVSALIHGLEDACAALRPWGVDVGVAGGETADIGDLVRTLTFDCALTARVPRAAVVDNGRIGPGDLIVGLASFGAPAAYEGGGYNSGIGANGLTAARHDVLGGGGDHQGTVAARYPESFDPELPPHLVYSGRRGLTEAVPPAWGLPAGTTIGKLLLSPTRTYAPILARLLREEEGGGGGLRGRIHGLVHCSGGGQTKALRCLPRGAPPLRLVKDALFPTPPVFRLIEAEQARQLQQQQQEEEGGSGPSSAAASLWREMYQVFNMGHRLEAYVADEAAARAVIDAAAALGVEGRVVGRVEPGLPGARGHVLEVSGEHGVFVYQ